MKKTWIILIAVLLILITAATVFYFTVTSPKYSLMKIKKAFDAHDITTFEEYVDVNGIVTRIIHDLPSLINLGNAADFLGAEAAQIIADLAQGNIIKQIDESVRTFIERGHFDKELTDKGTLSKILKEVPLNTIEVVQLGEIRKEGKICKVPLDIYVKDYDGNLHIEFMMRCRPPVYMS